MTILSILLFRALRSRMHLPPQRPSSTRIFLDTRILRGVILFAIVLLSVDAPLSEDSIGVGIEVQDCTVRFAREVKVPALETGPVASVSVRLNESVKQGDPIARLDDRSLLIRRQASQLRRDTAYQESNDVNEIEYAETVLKQAEAELGSNRSIYDDVPGAVRMTDVFRLQLAVERGELEILQAKKRHRVAKVEAELRQAELSLIDDQLRNLHIDSPLDGVILEVMRSAGEWIQKGEPIATIGQIDRLHVRALLQTDLLAPEDCPSLPVSVHWVDPTTRKPHSLRGKVLSVDPQVISGGQYIRIHAEIENLRSPDGSQWQLRPGTAVRMKVYPRLPSVTSNPSNSNRR